VIRAALGLGANLGDARAALRRAVAALDAHPEVEVRAVSGLWRTAPIGGPEQPAYLNAVVIVDSALAPDALLALAHELEAAAGRQRDVRWGPRTLDVDVIDVLGWRSPGPALQVPHPRAHERAFVLAPLSEVEPGWVLQPEGLPARTAARWLEHTAGQGVVDLGDGDWWR